MVLKYGDVSPSHRERFVSGAFDLSANSTRWLDYRHDASRVLAHTDNGGLFLEDSPEALSMRATLPNLPLADKALQEVREGVLQGLSIEFRSIDETRDGEIRVVRKAELAGVGLVANPSYEESKVETRQAGTISSIIPYGSSLSCECYRGSGNCHTVQFESGSLELPDEEEGQDLVAIFKSFAAPLGSRKKGTLRTKETPKGLEVEIDLPDTTYSQDIVAASEGVPLYVRPLFDGEDLTSNEIETDGELVAHLRNVGVRAILIGGTPNNAGWPEAKVTPSRTSRRERYQWL